MKLQGEADALLEQAVIFVHALSWTRALSRNDLSCCRGCAAAVFCYRQEGSGVGVADEGGFHGGLVDGEKVAVHLTHV